MTTAPGASSRTFPPDPVSARDARSFLRSFLHEQGRDDVFDAAQVALSEIVTNAVLHAHTDVDVAAALLDDGSLRIEVSDASPQLPAQRSYGDQATTGRGMQLVAAMTSDCGVLSRGALGKTVWFEVRGGHDGGHDDGYDDGHDDGTAGPAWGVRPLAPPAADGGTRIVLLGLPPTLWLAARQHHDAVLRELALYGQEHPDQAPTPERFAQADRARGVVSAAVVAEVDRRARADGAPTPALLPAAEPPFDLWVEVSADAATTYAALQDVLDVAERLARSGALLARPGLPEIVAVRDWVCEQIIAQCSGVQPAPWRGASEDLPATGTAPVPVEWDLREVLEAPGGAVAADDANRILAVSRPLADALGWAVDDLVGRRIVALVPPALREAHVAGFSRHLTTGETRVLGVPVQLPVLRADGSVVTCEVLIEQRAAVSGRHLYVAHLEPVD